MTLFRKVFFLLGTYLLLSHIEGVPIVAQDLELFQSQQYVFDLFKVGSKSNDEQIKDGAADVENNQTLGRSQGLVDLSHPILLIIDTDADMSDLMAILYLLKSPRVEVKAITTVGVGMTHLEYGAKNVSNLLELAGHSRIPVSLGARKPLGLAGSVPPEWQEEADEVGKIKLPHNPVHPVSLRASEYITNLIQNSPFKITLLCIGPMTNIAIALNEHPEIKDHIERIYIVGGALSVPGNIIGRPQGFKNRVAEYHIFLDAKAASDVFQSNIPITLVPLDIIAAVPITKEFYERVAEQRKTPSMNFVYEVIKPYGLFQKRFKSYFVDPLAAVIIAHPEIATYRDLKLAVNLKTGPEYGRLILTKKGSMVQVATGINAEAFYDFFLQTLNREVNLKQNHNESK